MGGRDRREGTKRSTRGDYNREDGNEERQISREEEVGQ